jgi:hypothetical protein
MPLEWVRSAPRLTDIDIEIPDGISADSIIYWLLKDLIGQDRPDTGFVTYGAVEYNFIEKKYWDIIVFPNPAVKEFFIIFDNPEAEQISIELIDITGRQVLEVYSGILSAGYQVYKVDKDLASGTYFVKILVNNNKLFIRKVVVSK